MTHHNPGLKKRTIVRFLFGAGASLIISGCGTVAPLGNALRPCPTTGPALCENFGPESRCNCANTPVLSRELDRFDVSARLGLRGW